LSIPVSNDTLLRAVRRRGSPSFPPRLGADDCPPTPPCSIGR
jgi:hypothetical protein